MSEDVAWSSPDGSWRISYPLPLLHEIDFDVSDGYRRIPRGGIEIGGVLFGRVQGDTVHIEATRPIECEHQFGPAFRLSGKDLVGLKAQIQAAGKDAELSRMQAIGWFVSHSRSDLFLSESEWEQFNELFPGPGRVTLLAKAEKFKPTQFAFLVRGATGDMPLDGRSGAFILPLPGRAGKPPESSVARPVTRQQPEIEPVSQPEAPPMPVTEIVPKSVAEVVERVRPEPVSTPVVNEPLSKPVVPEPVRPPAVEAEPVPSRPVEAAPSQAEPRALLPEERGKLTESGSAAGEIKEPAPHVLPAFPEERPHPRDFEPRRRQPEAVLRDGSARPRHRGLILVAAAMLGCVLGYILYLQIPPVVIRVGIEPVNGQLVVVWPAEQTKRADAVLLRVNDGEPVPVPPADRMAGRTQIPSTNARVVKVEIIAQHKLGDSRGIVEFLR